MNQASVMRCVTDQHAAAATGTAPPPLEQAKCVTYFIHFIDDVVQVKGNR